MRLFRRRLLVSDRHLDMSRTSFDRVDRTFVNETSLEERVSFPAQSVSLELGPASGDTKGHVR
jgi:hypothetical protein